MKPEQDSTLTHRCATKEYKAWKQKAHSARFTILAAMRNDLIGEFEDYPNAKSIWGALEARDLELLVMHSVRSRRFRRSSGLRLTLGEHQDTLKTKDMSTLAMVAESLNHKAKKPKQSGSPRGLQKEF
ncbi:uncharacterized protein A4U43_C07F29290 [Asparagus officinalis]|uniref:Uncharacterized protein n=1 Tax=Asparagus officinalis TaxID=4686 RepID=A0A5P1EJF7_ASPOF|nr:uncharacterized protein A4U43_C07F29290 [Asparagus officinalis]